MSIRTTAKNPDDQKYFDYLVELRDSNATNMWGASPYLAKKFRIGAKEAGEIFVRWVDSFKEAKA